MAVSVSLHLYRFESNFDGSLYIKTGCFPKDINVADIKFTTPVNATLGPDLPGLPYLYSKITMANPGLLQEAYVMQTVAQVHTLKNA